ncbi:dTDP-4-dehydrorhamnose 3-2C5-epimerase [Mariniflexile rhizosphaerae]|uniref:dTDP-4-dehydrorhamnose 3,5-epimerase n=1 Tax=unclassified Mariniflexile TaxID=2643887 RepID=UPI000CB3216F|nr:dTDP-4-dehydrorhamnose 3,5-epimerase [Mariniflexile sp. TRM1-10]AXP80590.1 dTDP-4-dehydrorhamnose 3-2C5-epimerase [Mariniflexile sp. TRM1-10]PLB20135.1 MAG: dTDP-4-dehydrorhamnose 3,5-epimerase [Flavobacteriaceae bacterium FS1-H7996/R]
MKVEETYLKGCFVITPKVFEDERGYFFESFNKNVFESQTGIKVSFVQDNQSKSSKGVLRGLHFQRGINAQAKLVQVIKGKVLDVCVDLRKDSDTFGKHFSIILDDIFHKQLFIPKGFAHGFVVLEEDTIFSYKCDNFYNKASEGGIIFNDESLKIDWKLNEEELIISEKDMKLSPFKKANL